jgi:outer membrane protease
MTFSIDDQLTWRVTPENPIREVDAMDWERYASLHNLITHLGWTGLGNPEAEMPRRTWWQSNITNESLEEEWSGRLSAPLKLFLQTAYETPHENSSTMPVV